MTIFKYSRYRYVYAEQDDDDSWFLPSYEPFVYREIDDNVVYVASGDDTFADIAGRFYQNNQYGCRLHWAVADFQPEDDPIIDPTLKIPAGKDIVIPSEKTIESQVFNEDRRRFS
jgi:hypothetical protein